MSQPHPSFRALHVAQDLIAALPDVIRAVATHDRPLADQLRRAAQSVLLNLAEAGGHAGGNRRQRVHSAFGSALETKAALHVALHWRYADAAKVADAHELADRVSALCYRMLHPR